MKRKYALHPGYVTSRTDKQSHYISVQQLVELYKVDLRHCIVWDDTQPETFCGRFMTDYIHLYPQQNEQYYILPEDRLEVEIK